MSGRCLKLRNAPPHCTISFLRNVDCYRSPARGILKRWIVQREGKNVKSSTRETKRHLRSKQYAACTTPNTHPKVSYICSYIKQDALEVDLRCFVRLYRGLYRKFRINAHQTISRRRGKPRIIRRSKCNKPHSRRTCKLLTSSRPSIASAWS